MIYLMKNGKMIMEFGLMECTIFDKGLIPENLKIKTYNKQEGNTFFLKTNSYNEMFEYLLSFIDDKTKKMVEMDKILLDLSHNHVINKNGYYFEENNTLLECLYETELNE